MGLVDRIKRTLALPVTLCLGLLIIGIIFSIVYVAVSAVVTLVAGVAQSMYHLEPVFNYYEFPDIIKAAISLISTTVTTLLTIVLVVISIEK